MVFRFRDFMDVVKRRYLIAIIFFTVLGLRLFFAFQTPEFSDDYAYYVLRQAENIKETGLPMFQDDLSYFQHVSRISPVFYFVIGFFGNFIPLTLAAKLIPNIAASSIVFVVYALSFKITRHIDASLFSAFLSGFIPVFFIETINSVSVYSLVVPLVLYAFYSFLMIASEERYVYHFIITMALLSFTHPSVFVVLFGLVIYYIIMKSESIETKHIEIEVIIVSAFLVLWSQFLIYKNVFLAHGLDVIGQNIPVEMISSHMASINILDAIYLIGIIPAFFGAHTLYQYILERKSRYMFFFLSYSLPVFFMLWFNVVDATTGLILLGPALVVISAKYFQNILQLVAKSKFSHYRVFIVTGIILIFVATTFTPTISRSWDKMAESPSPYLVESLKTLDMGESEDGVLLAPLSQSHLAQYYSRKKTFLNLDFLLIEDVEELYGDYKSMYSTIYETDALRLFDRYSISHILYTPAVEDSLGIENVPYVSDESCFDEQYGKGNIELYVILCTLEEYR